MIKIFGLNIITEKELNKMKTQYFGAINTIEELKHVYEINSIYCPQPKCQHCDQDRYVRVTLPDGTHTKVKCSCAEPKYIYKIEEAKGAVTYIKNDSGNLEYYCDHGWRSHCKLITKKKEIGNYSYTELFSSKNLAEYALQLHLKHKEESRHE